MKKEVAIVGGGLAGLACAIQLEKLNINYKLFESSNKVGGRIETYQRKNLNLDRGFQILLPSFGICKQLLDYDKLNLKYYPKGANLLTKEGNEWFGLPIAFPKKYQRGTKLSPTLNDYVLLGVDVIKGFKNPKENSFKNNACFIERYSHNFSEKFLQPFFRGVFLNQDWESNYKRFRYYLNCFLKNGAAVPELGMQEIPKQLLEQCNSESILLEQKVEKITDNKIISNKKEYNFDYIVCATDMSNFYKLINQPEPKNQWNVEWNYVLIKKGSTNLGPLNLVSKPSIVSHFNIPTLISSKMAPANVHAMIVNSAEKHQPHEIEKEIHQLTNEREWTFVWEDHIPKATPKTTLTPKISNDHINICGDWTSYASIEGALSSGSKTAKKLAKLINK